MPKTNYHSHTKFSDGKGSPEEYVQQAIALGMEQYGFSDHAPLPFECDWCTPKDQLENYFTEVKRLKEKYQGQIEILCSLEIDYVPEIIGPANFADSLDYTVGSVHYGTVLDDGTLWELDAPLNKFELGLNQIAKGDIKKAVKIYFDLNKRMLQENPPDILGHMDKIKMHNKNKALFSEEESWYKNEIIEVLEIAADKEIIVEINTRGHYKKIKDYYPSQWVWKELKRLKNKIVINSDCHHPSEINKGFDFVAREIKHIGIKELMVWEAGSFKAKQIELV